MCYGIIQCHIDFWYLHIYVLEYICSRRFFSSSKIFSIPSSGHLGEIQFATLEFLEEAILLQLDISNLLATALIIKSALVKKKEIIKSALVKKESKHCQRHNGPRV